MWRSLGEYFLAVLRWWVVALGAVAGAVWFRQDLVPTPELPTWKWVLMGCFGLMVAQFLAFHRLRRQRDELKSQLDDRGQRRAIQDTLGRLMNEAIQLRRRCENEQETPPQRLADAWQARAETFLRDQLGESYAVRFQNDAGLPAGLSSISSFAHRELWGKLGHRVIRLQKFLQEYR